MYIDSGHTTLSGTNAAGATKFSTALPYTLTFPGATQEGLIGLSSTTANLAISGIVLEKALLRA